MKKEIIKAGKKISYEIHTTYNGQHYTGLSVIILDMSKPILDNHYVSINPASTLPTIATNINPCDIMQTVYSEYLVEPAECWRIDESIKIRGQYYCGIKGKYLGNIMYNIPGEPGYKICCFISQKDNKRYYQFLDLQGANVLTNTEWDFDSEYLGIMDEEGNEIYEKKLDEMNFKMEITTRINENGEEELVDFNEQGVTEEGIKKYNNFKENMELLREIYTLEQIQTHKDTHALDEK